MNITKRILMAERIERAANDELKKPEIKAYCSTCGHSQKIRIASGESKTIVCPYCETMYGLTVHNVEK